MQILTLNGGSSSLKFALYEWDGDGQITLEGKLDRIGLSSSKWQARGGDGKELPVPQADAKDRQDAIHQLLDWLGNRTSRLSGIGHRLVHGGPRFSSPQRLTAETEKALEEVAPLAPNHLPQELAAIQAVRERLPDTPQIACFDTAFHRKMPRLAQLTGLPRKWAEEGVVRYGFHGLSYEYITTELQRRRELPPRVILAHLGNGASVCAVCDGRSMETSMGLTPTGGLLMGTRSGDLDPGVLLYLLQQRGLSAAAVADLVTKESGLKGLSGDSSDMGELEERAAADEHAQEAIDVFCYRVRQYIGAYAAVLGGVDLLVFTGGIGEHSALVRGQVCRDLQWLGVSFDEKRNQGGDRVISAEASRVRVMAMPTNEEYVIARQTAAVLAAG